MRPTGLTRRGAWLSVFSASRVVLTRSLQWVIPLPRKLLHAVCCFHFNDALQKNYIYYGMTLTV